MRVSSNAGRAMTETCAFARRTRNESRVTYVATVDHRPARLVGGPEDRGGGRHLEHRRDAGDLRADTTGTLHARVAASHARSGNAARRHRRRAWTSKPDRKAELSRRLS